MSDGSAYLSNHADVLAKWDETTALYDAYGERCKAIQDEHPEFVPLERSHFGHGRHICGLRHRDGGADAPGPEWRYQKTMDGWVPDRRTKAGKALQRRFQVELAVNGLGIFPGMPAEILVPGHWYAPGMFEHERTIYVHWAAEPSQHVETQKSFDSSRWERCPLSVFYAAKEASEAVKAG